MRIKIHNRLESSDFERILYPLESKPFYRIEILDEIDLDFLKTNPLSVFIRESGYMVDGGTRFEDPIASDILYTLKEREGIECDDSCSIGLSIERSTIDAEKLESDTTFSLRVLENILNNTCKHYREVIDKDLYTIDSKNLTRRGIPRKRSGGKSYEEPKPFGTIHAKNSGEARALATEAGRNLIPVYKETDKYHLFKNKKVYWLLPRKSVNKILKCDKTTMIEENEFSEDEKPVLKDLERKGWIKKRKIRGKVYYYGLNEETKKLITKTSIS